jgi:hypothetical protein
VGFKGLILVLLAELVVMKNECFKLGVTSRVGDDKE